MNELAIFNFESKTIRTHIDSEGNPWWVAKDLCEILELGNIGQVLSRLKENQKANITTNDGSQRRNITIISEASLYELIFTSRKESAVKFKDWVFETVLPSIRKTGSYNTDEKLDYKAKQAKTGSIYIESALSVAKLFGLEGNQALLYANKATKREVGIDFQSVLQIELKSETQVRYFNPTELGLRLSMSAQKFNKVLEQQGYQVKKNNVWVATDLGKKHSLLLDAGKKHSDGTPIQQLKWEELVLDLFVQKAA